MTRPILALVAGLVATLGPVSTGELAVANPASDVSRGRKIYHRYCATCHGRDGDGNGPTTKYLRKPRPQDFRSGNYKFKSTAGGTVASDADLARTIRRGVPGTSMPGWSKMLSRRGILDVVGYIKTFSSRFADKAQTPRLVVVRAPFPAPTKRSIQRGRVGYLLLGCAQCHGVEGKGGGDRMHPADLTRRYFRGGDRPEDLYRALVVGREGTPMPGYGTGMMPVRELSKQLHAVQRNISTREVAAIRAFVSKLPTATQFLTQTSRVRSAAIERFRWDIVHYVRSLSCGRD